MRRHLISTVIVLLFASPMFAYTIYLKDGSRIVAEDKWDVQGDNAIIVLPNGTRTSIKLSEIDLERTEAANENSLGGDAFIVEGGQVHETAVAPPPTKRGRTLSDVAASRQVPDRLGQSPNTRGSASVPEQPTPAELPMTQSGHVDLMRVNRQPLTRSEISDRILTLLLGRGIEQGAIYRGTQADRIFLEITANSEATVFRALEAAAFVFAEVHTEFPEITAFELYMANDRRQRAGQFLLTPERAAELASNEIDVQNFFISYVEF